MNQPKKYRLVVVLSGVALLVFGVVYQWKTSKVSSISNQTSLKGSPQGMPQISEASKEAIISRSQFLSLVFENIKPPRPIAKVLIDGKEASKDSLLVALKWSKETQNQPLASLLELELLNYHGMGDLTEIARNSIFVAASITENGKVSAYLYENGKKLIDEGLAKDSTSMPLRNALIIYQSEYLNQPMAFLKTLRTSQKIDSNDLELNYIHLNLLKKSNQWEKAIKKLEKLVSLQPQNPYWLFETSDLYGMMGDSTNAKIYLDLAVEMQRKIEPNR